MFQSVIWTPIRCRMLNSDSLGIYTTRFCQLIEPFDQMTCRRFLLRLSSLLPLTLLVITWVIRGNSTTSNQLEAGSIMVRAIKSIDEEPSLPLRVYGPKRSTHRASQGMHIKMEDVHTLVIASYLFGKSCMTLFWIWMVIRIHFQYTAAFIVSLRRVCSGCWR